MTDAGTFLRDLTPEGVDRKPLGEIGTFIRGRRFTKADYVEVGLPSIHYGEIYTTYGTVAFGARRFVRPELRSTLRLAGKGDIVIAGTGENVSEVGKAVAWMGDDPVAVHDDCFILTDHGMDPEFLSYFFQSTHFHEQKTRLASESKLARISGANLATILTPIPAVETQVAIAQVLKQMERLEAELEAELEARRRQYEFYRDSLLSFQTEPPPRSIRLSDVAVLYGGLTGKSKQDFSGGDSRFVAYTEVFALPTLHALPSNLVRVEPGERQNRVARGDVLFTASSESAAEVGMSSVVMIEPDEPLYLNSFCFGLRFNDDLDIDPRFARHLFRSTPMRRAIAKTASGVTRFNISKDRFRRLEIPLPSIADQQRIASTLDALDALVNDLTSGLPAEIAARRTQYEYYRDRLLSFEPA